MPTYSSELNISDHELEMFQKSATPYWRQQRSDRRQAAYDSIKSGYKEYARDHFTGASGGTFYGSDVFPSSFYGSIFTGDVAGNLVHRDVLKSVQGQPAYVALRDEREKNHEFLASTDSWFRPANFNVGPDGNLYMLDIYRQHIETPVSIPEDLKTDMDFSNGVQYGRIWKISPKVGKGRATIFPELSTKRPDELVAFLESSDQWWRLTAQRILLEKQDKSVVPLLKKMFTESKDARGRLHALYTLEGLNMLEAVLVKKALSDSEAGVREHGLILAERYDGFLPDIIKLTNDVSPQVAFQATLSLGQLTSKDVVTVLCEIIEKNAENGSYRLAVLSSLPGGSPELAKILLKNGVFFSSSSAGKLKFIEDYAYIAGSRNGKEEINSLLTVIVKSGKDYQIAALTGLTKGARRSKSKVSSDKSLIKNLEKLAETEADDVKKAVAGLRKVLSI